MRRSGTYMTAYVNDNDKFSTVRPFVFSDEQTLTLEFSDFKLRFILENGVLTFAPVTVTDVLTVVPMKITVPGLGAAIGDQIALSGFPAESLVNSLTAKVTAVAGNDYTLDINYDGVAGPVLGAMAAKVYAIATPFGHVEARTIRYLQSLDVVYLLCKGKRPYKLSRFGAYNWTITPIEFSGGPFMPVDSKNGRLTLGSTGNPVPIMTSDTAPSGIAFGATVTAAWHAFDGNPDTSWVSNAQQSGEIGYQFTVPVVINGYVIYMDKNANNSADYKSKDYAPGDWTFEGWDGAAWVILDVQSGYVLYDNNRSVKFTISNSTAYIKYRLNITACTRNGPLNPRVSMLALVPQDEALRTINLTLIAPFTGLNGGAGFLATDVGRLIRVKGSDQTWRVLKINGFTDATHASAVLLDEPFVDATAPVLDWQIGYWSDTKGWPSVGGFFDDRLWLAGVPTEPDLLCASRTGSYEDFTQRSATDEVLDDSAIVLRLNSDKLETIRWLKTDQRGMLAGTSVGEWAISANDTNSAVSGRNVKGRSPTERGSADIDAVKVDSQILYIQKSKRTVREFSYAFENDGYKSPSMSLFASHLGVPRFVEMVYAAEPHSIVWFRRENGSVAALTYNREESVIGWHQHDFGGEVESMCVVPSASDFQDTLWMVIKRVINGTPRRFIERLVRFWDFDSVIENAHFVDCGLRYSGPPTSTLIINHLDGALVDGIADGVPFEQLPVIDGKLELGREASVVVVGLPYISYGEISRTEAGAEDGTAQGKTKRIHNTTPFLWDSAYGELGIFNEDQEEDEWVDIEYREPYDEMEPIKLQTGMFGPSIMPAHYGKRGSVLFRQTKPLPFNLIALLPQLDVQDR